MQQQSENNSNNKNEAVHATPIAHSAPQLVSQTLKNDGTLSTPPKMDDTIMEEMK